MSKCVMWLVAAWAWLGLEVRAWAEAATKARLAVMELRVATMEGKAGARGENAAQVAELGKGLQSMITTDLAQVASLELVERARLKEIEAELELGTSGLVDPKTAVKLGKLAGATHLVTGSVAVIGDRMRIDGQIVAVGDGRVVVAEKIEGERDAFFELEKALVKQIVDGVGVKLAVKERGAIARVHTTDFEAFRAFSHAVALFDDQQYAEAIAALRAAQDRDKDFQLATVTLAQYQDVVSRLTARADDLATAQANVAKLAQQGQARGEAEAIAKLHAIVDGKGNDGDHLAAIYILAAIYGDLDGAARLERRDAFRIHSIEDRFALQRAADGLVRRYWAEAQKLFPKWLPVVRDELNALPRTAGEVDDAIAKARTVLEGGKAHRRYGCIDGKGREIGMLCNLTVNARDTSHIALAERLGLDGKQAVELDRQLYELGARLDPPPRWRQQMLEALAEAYRNVADFGRSSAVFTQLAGQLNAPDEIRAVTRKIEDNRKVAEALARARHAAELRELMGNASHTALNYEDAMSNGRSIEHMDRDPAYLQRELGKSRRFPHSPFNGLTRADVPVWIGDHRVWQMQAAYFGLGTGPRSDPRRAKAIRYMPDRDPGVVDTLLVVDGVARSEVRAAFEVDFAAQRETWAFRGDNLPYQAPPGRAEISFVFGMRDLDVARPREGKQARPFRAFALVIGGDAVRLEELQEDGYVNERVEMRDGKPISMTQSLASGGIARDPKRLAHKELARKAARIGGAVIKASFEVKGRRATATVNGASYAFALPGEASGYYGIGIAGNGFAELRALSTSPASPREAALPNGSAGLSPR